jgi:CheY-like chemotaxis protein
MDIRILAAEDRPTHYNNLVAVLRTIPRHDKDAWRIDDLKFTPAATSSMAIKYLEMEARGGRPYDILVLDLGLPSEEGGIEDVEHGFEVLRAARELRAAKQTVIYTVHSSDRNILRALREGASDFVEKPDGPNFDEQELQTRFVTCWQRIIEADSAALFEQRIKELVPHAGAGLAQRFTACFTDIIQKVDHNAKDIEHYAYERFRISMEKDSQDYLMRLLSSQDADLKAALDNWAGLNADLLGCAAEGRSMTLGALFDSVIVKLSPCLLVKNTELRKALSGSGEAALLSFQEDVRVIVQEVMAGGLSELHDYGPPRELEVTAAVNDGQVEVHFADDFDAILPEEAQAINRGSVVGPDHAPVQFGRAWGLSVAQHIALRGGGRLIVKPRQGGRGNVVTYFAPLAPPLEDEAVHGRAGVTGATT